MREWLVLARKDVCHGPRLTEHGYRHLLRDDGGNDVTDALASRRDEYKQMALKTPSHGDFDVQSGPYETIKVTFKPTGSWFVFDVVTDPSERARIGWIAGRYEIHHQSPSWRLSRIGHAGYCARAGAGSGRKDIPRRLNPLSCATRSNRHGA